MRSVGSTARRLRCELVRVVQAFVLCSVLMACGRVGFDLLLTGRGSATDAPDGPTASSDAGCAEAACQNDRGDQSCSQGSCANSCAVRFSDCDGDARNGCEADLMNDPAHCGACAEACDDDNQICAAGVCVASPCPKGLGECDGDMSTDCETDLATALSDCRFCGNRCQTENGTPSCQDRACVIEECSSGYGDCDDLVSSGCETELAGSTAHCGACNTPCTNEHGTTRCASSECKPVCSAGYDDCDADARNGCEAALDTVSDCGVCGRACPADAGPPVCNAGVCETRCELDGTYALRVTLAASWLQTGAIGAGVGTFQAWIRVGITQAGTALALTLDPCQISVPPFRAWQAPESFLYQYENILFDGGFLPQVAGTAKLGDRSPTASFAMPSAVFQLGIRMNDPINDIWPSQAAGLLFTPLVDVDKDGKPGVTAPYANLFGYVLPRTSGAAVGFTRADRAYMVSRSAFSLAGSMSGCDSSEGAANVTRMEARVLGCRISGSIQDCSSAQSGYIDSSVPAFQLGLATYRLVKVADEAACPDVRLALP